MKSPHSLSASIVSMTCALALVARAATPQEWNSVPPGRETYGATIAELAIPDGKGLQVKLGEPVVIAVADKPHGWGYFQFPTLTRLPDGRLQAKWSMNDDSITAYGKAKHGGAVSTDGGESWEVLSEPVAVPPAVLLPNGDRIAVHVPEAIKAADLKMPAPIAEVMKPGTKEIRSFYRLDELPEERRGVLLRRQKSGANDAEVERAALDDPRALRHSMKGLVPIVWWGDMQIASDNSIVMGAYPGYSLREDGSFDKKAGVFFYRSTDGGRSWKILSRVHYQPDLQADPKGDERIGYTEPAFHILPNGKYVCVVRTADADNGPMYVFRSEDAGANWTTPRSFAPSGVMPRLLALENGVLVLSSGRPGVQLRFNADGKGENWSEAVEMLPYANQKRHTTCGYTQLLATGPDRFLMVYSDFVYPNAKGELRKAIKVREVIVTAPSAVR